MRHKTMRFTVVEGPAGGGKTTLVTRLLTHSPMSNVPYEFPRPREYAGFEGATFALVKDYGRLSLAMSHALDHVGPYHYLLDRCFLSSFVYGALRGETDLPNTISWTAFLTDVQRLFAAYQADLRWRYSCTEWPHWQLQWDFIIVGPTLEILEDHRKGRVPSDFLYTPEVELRTYTRLYEKIAQVQQVGTDTLRWLWLSTNDPADQLSICQKFLFGEPRHDS